MSSAPAPALLEVEDLHVAYGGSRALQGVSLHVAAGEIVAVLGANGAGKTTLLNAIAGLLRPARGAIRLHGQPVHRKSPAALIRMGLALVPEGRHLFGELTVLDNLRLGAYARHFGGWNLLGGALAHRRAASELEADLRGVYDMFPRLGERPQQLAGSMSGGEQQMLAIGRALMARPRILLLDEPSLGLAPTIVKEILRLAGVLRERGLTVLLVEQNANQALRVADRAYVLGGGKLLLEGPARSLAADDGVRRAYLGGGVFKPPAAAQPAPASRAEEVLDGR